MSFYRFLLFQFICLTRVLLSGLFFCYFWFSIQSLLHVQPVSCLSGCLLVLVFVCILFWFLVLDIFLIWICDFWGFFPKRSFELNCVFPSSFACVCVWAQPSSKGFGHIVMGNDMKRKIKQKQMIKNRGNNTKINIQKQIELYYVTFEKSICCIYLLAFSREVMRQTQ